MNIHDLYCGKSASPWSDRWKPSRNAITCVVAYLEFVLWFHMCCVRWCCVVLRAFDSSDYRRMNAKLKSNDLIFQPDSQWKWQKAPNCIQSLYIPANYPLARLHSVVLEYARDQELLVLLKPKHWTKRLVFLKFKFENWTERLVFYRHFCLMSWSACKIGAPILKSVSSHI